MTLAQTDRAKVLFLTYRDPNVVIGKRYLAFKELIETYGIQKLAQCLRESQNNTLDLSCHPLLDQQIIDLSATLKTDTFFKTLILENCQMRGFGLKMLKEALANNKSLKKLNLNRNKLGDLGARLAREILESNSTLTQLSLNDNCIGIFGGKALGEALLVNQSLEVLHLRKNQLENQGMVEIFEGLRKNQSLTEIDTSENGFDEQINPTISGILLENTTLQIVNGYRIQIADKQRIRALFSSEGLET